MALAAPAVVAAAAVATAAANEPAKSRIGSMLTSVCSRVCSFFGLRNMFLVATTRPLAQRTGCNRRSSMASSMEADDVQQIIIWLCTGAEAMKAAQGQARSARSRWTDWRIFVGVSR